MQMLPGCKMGRRKDVSNVETVTQMQSMVAVRHYGEGQKICKLFLESHINVLVTMIWLLSFIALFPPPPRIEIACIIITK